MKCQHCGKEIPDGSGICDACNAKRVDSAPEQALPRQASIFRLRCPHCGGDDFMPLGTKGASGRMVANGALAGALGTFGAVGGAVAAAGQTLTKDKGNPSPIQYKCLGCKGKFESIPAVAKPDEYIAAPYIVRLERPHRFPPLPLFIFLNGHKIGQISGGNTYSFSTQLRYNMLFLTTEQGVGMKDRCIFEAEPNGKRRIVINRNGIFEK